MITTMLHVVTAAVATAAALAFICRLSAISWATTRASVVAVHLGGLLYCGSVLEHVARSAVELDTEPFGLAFCAMYLVMSYRFWRHGQPPDHSWRPGSAPMELDEVLHVTGVRDV
jgi:hypothetical protein